MLYYIIPAYLLAISKYDTFCGLAGINFVCSNFSIGKAEQPCFDFKFGANQNYLEIGSLCLSFLSAYNPLDTRVVEISPNASSVGIGYCDYPGTWPK